jgi:predicted  nucleic acid-binding Zn-ribbon protein
MFGESKLFREALSQQSSHYIQSKLLSLPKEAQDLKKLDLRHMCETVVRELEVVEKEAAYDYVKVSEELESLGQELSVADGIMAELEGVLYGFKDHLEAIKSEMTSLQEKSNKMNTSLSNKKKVQGLLASFIESAVLERELIDAICLGEINDAYVHHVRLLLKKLSKLSSIQIISTAI